MIVEGLCALIDAVAEPLLILELKCGENEGSVNPRPEILCMSGGASKILNDDLKIKDFFLDFVAGLIGGSNNSREAPDSIWSTEKIGRFHLSTIPISGEKSRQVYLVQLFPIDEGVAGTSGNGNNSVYKSALDRGLTNTESKIFEAMARGLENKEIATELKCSYHTVRTHIRNIFVKLSVSNRVEAITRVVLNTAGAEASAKTTNGSATKTSRPSNRF